MTEMCEVCEKALDEIELFSRYIRCDDCKTIPMHAWCACIVASKIGKSVFCCHRCGKCNEPTNEFIQLSIAVKKNETAIRKEIKNNIPFFVDNAQKARRFLKDQPRVAATFICSLTFFLLSIVIIDYAIGIPGDSMYQVFLMLSAIMFISVAFVVLILAVMIFVLGRLSSVRFIAILIVPDIALLFFWKWFGTGWFIAGLCAIGLSVFMVCSQWDWCTHAKLAREESVICGLCAIISNETDQVPPKSEHGVESVISEIKKSKERDVMDKKIESMMAESAAISAAFCWTKLGISYYPLSEDGLVKFWNKKWTLQTETV